MKGPAFYRATIGKKVVMAVTGVILVGWIIGHVLGNLLVFRGPAALNEYAALLKSNAALLWAMRAGLLVTVVLHVVAAVQLVRQEAASRPARYTKKVPQESTFASRTIRWGGLIIAVWNNYRPWIEAKRQEHGEPRVWENLEWLAGQMVPRRSATPAGGGGHLPPQGQPVP